MLEAIFSIGSFLLSAVADLAVATISQFMAKELDLGMVQRATAIDFRESQSRLRDINAGIEELRRKEIRDRGLAGADLDDLRTLEARRRETFEQYRIGKQGHLVEGVQEHPDSYMRTAVSQGNIHLVQYHLGLTKLDKLCSCGYPMVLNHRIGGGSSFMDYFWSCTAFYEGRKCRTIPFRPSDLSMLHDSSIPELQIPTDQLEELGSIPSMRENIQRRMDRHRYLEDDEVLCPLHHIPMVLHKKREHANDLLDMFHLRCPHLKDDWDHSCNQMVKLKSIAQLSAYLVRTDGEGIIPR
jgi:hypothetical protein